VVKRAVFLDRDGVLVKANVINGKSYAPRDLSDFKILSGSHEALINLKGLGFLLIVVTNQPDVGNGLVEKRIINQMHKNLANALPLDEIYVCFHSQEDGCSCRKPRAGLLKTAAKRHKIDLRQSYMIGDRKGDIEAGQTAGCFSIFIDHKYAEAPPSHPDAIACDVKVASEIIMAKV
jgi:D-glycero-D-manno-heptose 1,7-bisphosphate phosphatase